MGFLVEPIQAESGILVPVDDDVTMGRAIRNLLEDNDLRDRIARQGYEVYAENFTEKMVVEQYTDFLNKVAEAR